MEETWDDKLREFNGQASWPIMIFGSTDEQ